MSEEKKEKNPYLVEPGKYHAFFQRNPDGVAILTELAALFYDVPCHLSGGSAEDTAHIDGGRKVIKFIIDKCAQGGE